MNTGLTLVLLTLAVSSIIGIVMHFRAGHIRQTVNEVLLTSQDIGQPLAANVTFVQFSTAFCQPCRATKLMLNAISKDNPEIGHIEIDAESHLDLVRKFHITRTPTTLVVNRSGRVIGKAVGLPKKQEVLATIAALSAN
ncbi:MAG: thioredoxin family protein [Actinomycetes bacterium]